MKKSLNEEVNFPIDIVIPWVDGNDPAWRAVRSQYRSTKEDNDVEERYRSWGLLKYWFRAIERYAPWVRTIFFITWGHIPAWLDPNHPKVKIIRHEDFIPKKYLPTFNSHTIELNIFRIPELGEHFIYFNDDVYLNTYTKPTDFFEKGLPKDAAVMGIIKNKNPENFMPYIMLNMLSIINHSFNKKDVVKKHWKKWYSPKYGKYLLNNLYVSPYDCFTGFRNFHTCHAFLKSEMHKVWETYPDVLHETCLEKFRNRKQVNQYIFRYWQLVTDQFLPMKPNSKYYTIGSDSMEEIASAMKDKRNKVLCINDDPGDFDFLQAQKEIDGIFKQDLPQKSSFEI